MRMPDILAKKRDGIPLNSNEISYFVSGIINGNVSKEQTGAFLMAVYLNGMNNEEKIALTQNMLSSGDCLSWEHLPLAQRSLVVDKHSTGGVGDKMSIPLAPALAVCGLKVPMIAGRGLEHTGGTLDKLESIPGYSFNLTPAQIEKVVAKDSCCIAGQSSTMIPADRILYATRDITSTVASLPLITGSIISKKAAESLNALVLDVKVGKGAFMKNVPQAIELAESLVETSKGLGITSRALLTWMENPIGRTIGNALEIEESISILKGGGPKDSIDLISLQGAHLLQMTQRVQSIQEGQDLILKSFADGSALKCFQRMLINHNVDPETAEQVCSNPKAILPQAKYKTPVLSSGSGYIEHLDGMELAVLALKLGAGRSRAEDIIDPSVGIELLTDPGSKIQANEPWAILHHNDTLPEFSTSDLISISKTPVNIPPRLIQVVS